MEPSICLTDATCPTEAIDAGVKVRGDRHTVVSPDTVIFVLLSIRKSLSFNFVEV